MKSIGRLVSIGGPPLGGGPSASDAEIFEPFGERGRELRALLGAKNGFYAFESALHVFPAGPCTSRLTLGRWNSNDLWRWEYRGLADGKLFFAQEGFGNQFCIYDEQIWFFDAETGGLKLSAPDLDSWAARILEDYNMQTGYSLVRDWQKLSGPLQEDHRLIPKMPFVLGGQFEVSNLYSIDATSAMRFRGNLASQLKDVPDGASIEIKLIE